MKGNEESSATPTMPAGASSQPSNDKGGRVMKHYYAKKNGTCYRFTNKLVWRGYVGMLGATALTDAEAMHEFGYTDETNRKAVNATEFTPEEEQRMRKIVLHYIAEGNQI